ncbi:MAG: prephenate dehydratase, partial [Ktedonobacteraceae bacterium]
MAYSADAQTELDEDVRKSRETIDVAFQGERGAFGDEATRVYFGQREARGAGRQVSPAPCKSFADVFRAVASGEAAYGLVPVENSQAGSINDVYDLLRQHDLFIIGELSYEVNQCLLCLKGQKLEDIKRVISHPQALAQSDIFLRELGVEVVATYDTAGSAKMVRDEQLVGVAAIAAAGAAEIYGLDVLVHDVQTIKGNFTRFIALGREPAPREEGPAKTMLVMATAHQPGSLHKCLGFLAANNINVLKLESRPSRQRVWEYVFYLDFEGHRDDVAVRKALAQLAEHTTFCKVLGSF